jgi:acetyl esterase/lipase
MALDFSQYGGPSDEWLEVEKTMPSKTFDVNADPVALQTAVNKERDERAAPVFAELSSQIETKDHTIPTRDGSTIQARTYRSINASKTDKLPVYIHLHGGGFTFGTLECDDPACAQLAIRTGVIVFNVNYRHAPQYTHPTAFLDTQDAYAYLQKNIESIGGDPSKVIIGGVSAGAQITASLVLEQNLGKSLTDLPKFAGQVLIIPCVASPVTYDQGPGKKLKVSSYVENEFAPILPKTTVDYFVGLQKVPHPDLKDTKVNMVNATEDEVKGFPPTMFGIAGLDPLRDEGLLYAKLLSEAKVPTETRLFKGVPHGHRRFGKALKASDAWDKCIEDGIAFALSKPAATGKFEVNVV